MIDTFTLLTYGAFTVLGITTIILFVLVYKLTKRIEKLTLGTNGKSLEDAIYALMDDHEIFQNRVTSVEQTTGRLDAEIKHAVRGVATVRYNAFTDVGGKQSFATAMVSEDGTGVVISSIYARDRVNVYAKPIIDFKSEYELSREESQALSEAKSRFI